MFFVQKEIKKESKEVGKTLCQKTREKKKDGSEVIITRDAIRAAWVPELKQPLQIVRVSDVQKISNYARAKYSYRIYFLAKKNEEKITEKNAVSRIAYRIE